VLCVFDVNETLLDLSALDEFFAEVAGDPAARKEWFDLMIHNALVVTAAGGYRPFGQIAAACLPAVAGARGRTATAEQQRELGERMRRLPAHPEAVEALDRLRAAGFGVVALTNSVLAVAEDQLRNSGLLPLFDAVYSADQAGRLKPAPEPYRFVVDSRRVAAADAVLVAAHDWDVAGAAAAGLRAAFVAREGRVPLAAVDAPAVTGTDLADVADQLIAGP
jgi:2-haloacid dehalogenase